MLTKSRIFNVRENKNKPNHGEAKFARVSLCKAPNETRTATRHEARILSTTVTFDYFALMFADIPVLYFLQPIRDCVSTRNLEVLVRRSNILNNRCCMFEIMFPVSSLPVVWLWSSLIDVCFHIAAPDWIMLQEENSSCKFGALQLVKVVRARSIQWEASDFEKV